MIKSFALSAETAHTVHFIFEWLAILVGVQVYRSIRKKRAIQTHAQTTASYQPAKPQSKPPASLPAGITQGKSFAVAIGCILGAGIGNKLVFLAEMPHLFAEHGLATLALGQSIVGGFIGGLIGVEIAKKIVGLTQSTGDDFILPMVVGICIGRIGCFSAGLHDGTYGIATSLPWGVDFGDGIARHPTQLYDMLWALATFFLLYTYRASLQKVAGLSFKLFLIGYIFWRLLVDGIKPVPYEYWLGWSGIQWVCAIFVLGYLPFVYKDFARLNSKGYTSLN